jgi:hypothetical protein
MRSALWLWIISIAHAEAKSERVVAESSVFGGRADRVAGCDGIGVGGGVRLAWIFSRRTWIPSTSASVA